jgi:hypothetical protein
MFYDFGVWRMVIAPDSRLQSKGADFGFSFRGISNRKRFVIGAEID